LHVFFSVAGSNRPLLGRLETSWPWLWYQYHHVEIVWLAASSGMGLNFRKMPKSYSLLICLFVGKSFLLHLKQRPSWQRLQQTSTYTFLPLPTTTSPLLCLIPSLSQFPLALSPKMKKTRSCTSCEGTHVTSGVNTRQTPSNLTGIRTMETTAWQLDA
jgi:hypothetical protein